MNKEEAIKSYKNREVLIDHLPRIIFVELTQHCNLKCSMCHHYDTDFSKNIMKKSTFDLIAKSFFNQTEIVDLRGWGESVTLPDFHKFVEITSKYNAIPRVVTNLSYHNDIGLDSLAKANAIINISLDAANDKLLKKIRGGAELNLILNNILKLKKWYSDYQSGFENLSLGVTVQKQNICELTNIIHLAKNYGIKNISLFPRQNDGDFYPLLKSKDIIELKDELNKSMNFAKKNNINLRVGAKLFPDMQCNIPKFSFPCIKPWEYCFISWDGYMTCCDFLIGPGSEYLSFGNIHEWEPLWLWKKSPRAIKFRKSHIQFDFKTAPYGKFCLWCYKNRYVDFEDIFDTEYNKRVVDESNWDVI